MNMQEAKLRLENWYQGEDADISLELLDCAYKAICNYLETKDYLDCKQNDKELINIFIKKLKSKFANKLYFEYRLNLSDINSIIDEVSKEMT